MFSSDFNLNINVFAFFNMNKFMDIIATQTSEK